MNRVEPWKWALLLGGVLLGSLVGGLWLVLASADSEGDNIYQGIYTHRARSTRASPRPGSYVNQDGIYQGIYRHGVRSTRVLLRPGGYVNQDGFIGRDYAILTPKGTYRIMALGDSVTMYGAMEGHGYPALLEASLPEITETKVEVLNLAVGGYDTSDQLESLQQIGLKYNPQLIVVGHCINDGVAIKEIARSLAPAGTDFTDDADDRRRTHTRLRTLMEGPPTISPGQLLERSIRPSPLWARSQAAFEELAKISKERKIPVLLLILPSLDQAGEEALAPAHQAVADRGRELGFAVLDLRPAFRAVGDDAKLRSDAADALHFSRFAHQVAAETIRAWFARERPWQQAASKQ
jgi:hypothetical protein